MPGHSRQEGGEKSLWGGAVFPGTLPPDQYSQGSNLMGGGRDLRQASSTIIVLFCIFSFPQKSKNGRGKNPLYAFLSENSKTIIRINM